MCLIGAMVCLLAAPWVQLSVSAGNGRPHNALRHHWLMPVSCHFRDCKSAAGHESDSCKKRAYILREIHLRTTGRHLSVASHSVICHPTEVIAPPSPQPGRLVLDLSTHNDERLSWPSSLVTYRNVSGAITSVLTFTFT